MTTLRAMRRAAQLGLAAVLFGCSSAPAPVGPTSAGTPSAPAGPSADWLFYHRDRARTGWDAGEPGLTVQAVGPGSFGPLWNAPVLDPATLEGRLQPPHIYASPLYVDRLRVVGGSYADRTVGAAIVATSAGWVYAIAVHNQHGGAGPSPGTVLWRRFLGTPTPTLDGGVAVGVLGTPAIDLDRAIPLVYVASDVIDASGRSWRVFAIDLRSGEVRPGWPLVVDDATVGPVTVNGPARFQKPAEISQRGGLNLSPDGRILYVPFGAHGERGTGFLVAVDTAAPRIASAFASVPSTALIPGGGMWGAGGPALDEAGDVFETTGNTAVGLGPTPNAWGDSLLAWRPGVPLVLTGTYTPWNYCQMDRFDTDLGGSAPMVLPSLAGTRTPRLLAIGGKQGNAYLLDRDHLRGSLTSRQPCGTDAAADTSLLPPGAQPQFGTRGPLNLFGPYSDDQNNQSDFAKARTTPAFFRAADGTAFVYFAGSTKVAKGRREPMPPSLVRTRVMTVADTPAYLTVDRADTEVASFSPGSPVVTSDGAQHPIVWMLDANVHRTQSLTLATTPRPVLYAFDGITLRMLWHSGPSDLDVGGKYAQPTVAHGIVLVATDRLQAFGVLPK
jgi:hypothetical protein